MSRGPQDPTGVDGVKQLHGHFSAWHQFHINRHHWVVYNRYKNKTTHIQLRCDDKNIVQLMRSISHERLSGACDIPKGPEVVDRLETTSGSLKKHCIYRRTHEENTN